MIRAVSRALAIFDAFDEQHLSLSLQEIGERIAMPKATTFRLVNSLERGGFLVRLDNQQYCLSLKMVRLAGLVKSTIGIREVSRPVMIAVAKQTGETVTVNALSGHERICIDVIDTPSPLMTIVRPGEHLPLLHGATGKALLAYRTPEELDAIIKASPGGDRIDRKSLDEELKLVRERGYALTSGQRVQGITAIGVPLRDMKEEVHHSLALTGPSIRMDPRIEEFAQIMLAAGAEISSRLGSILSSRTIPHE
ncbi:IclR family transcriptional regulator [Rhodoligotrophos ferricapiens]|uniref:IclR family transcriptional regulator n=1 Tax=Rhodoligotrophos ferricapiens TaxID=3069264 RepID=UPI00315DBDD5